MSDSPIDWSQLWYPGPKRAFTAAEMAQAGSDGPSATLCALTAVNSAMVVFGLMLLAPSGRMAGVAAVAAVLCLAGWQAFRYLWQRPWRQPLMLVMVALTAPMFAGSVWIKWHIPLAQDRLALGSMLGIGSFLLLMGLWFLVVWRSHQIESRLREQAERARSIEMARRLAAAQIEPHFLFNTLASAQHWVQTGDPRAGPLLAALTGYLRATLPLFQQAELPAAAELLAVQRYLEVMQARMGSRLRWQIDVDSAARHAPLPPGMLLTLVENAVVHGLEPQLAGGSITLSGRADGRTVTFNIDDNGTGLPTAVTDGALDGIGLANIRERLQLAHGSAASLRLQARPEGGCRAQLQLPWNR